MWFVFVDWPTRSVLLLLILFTSKQQTAQSHKKVGGILSGNNVNIYCRTEQANWLHHTGASSWQRDKKLLSKKKNELSSVWNVSSTRQPSQRVDLWFVLRLPKTAQWHGVRLLQWVVSLHASCYRGKRRSVTRFHPPWAPFWTQGLPFPSSAMIHPPIPVTHRSDTFLLPSSFSTTYRKTDVLWWINESRRREERLVQTWGKSYDGQ